MPSADFELYVGVALIVIGIVCVILPLANRTLHATRPGIGWSHSLSLVVLLDPPSSALLGVIRRVVEGGVGAG